MGTSATSAAILVVWLHGLGADGTDLMPVADFLRLPSELPIRHLFPDAPVRPVTINGGYNMRAWYDIWRMDLQEGVDEDGIAESVRSIVGEIGMQRQHGEQVVLIGFSQGGVIALGAALALQPQPLGVAMLSSYAPYPDLAPAAGLAVFIGHGSHDDVVPVAASRHADERLRAVGARSQYHRYPMGHSISEEEIEDLRNWLLALLRGSG
jgi:phospholipase/carboxylesterase